MNEFGKDNWQFVGRRVLEDARGEWSEENPEGISGDDGYPIYNFAYPLFREDISDEVILKVCEETSCTVVYHNHEDKYYLALTGCGMDLSQDIALAYMMVDGCIDWDMLDDVYIGGPLSIGKDDYIKLLTQLETQLEVRTGDLRKLLEAVRRRQSEYGGG